MISHKIINFFLPNWCINIPAKKLPIIAPNGNIPVQVEFKIVFVSHKFLFYKPKSYLKNYYIGLKFVRIYPNKKDPIFALITYKNSKN